MGNNSGALGKDRDRTSRFLGELNGIRIDSR